MKHNHKYFKIYVFDMSLSKLNPRLLMQESPVIEEVTTTIDLALPSPRVTVILKLNDDPVRIVSYFYISFRNEMFY